MMVTRLVVLLVCLTSATFAEELDGSFIYGSANFTAAVYNEISKKGESNFLVSPFSAETVLAFVQSGGQGETSKEIRSVLYLLEDQEQIGKFFKSVSQKFRSQNNYDIYTANKLYLRENFTIKDGFKATARDVFDADLETINFDNRDEAVDVINQWVAKQTKDKIQELVSNENIDENTVGIIVNGVYFRGNWSSPFKRFNTKKESFYVTDDRVVEVDTLQSYRERYNYFDSEELDAQFLEVPFEGGDASIVFVLPNQRNGIGRLEQQINQVFLPRNFSQDYFNVVIPKFRIENQINVRDIVENLGIKKAFRSKEADFGGISDEHLFINYMIQKTFISLDERGVEAAAATFIDFSFDSALILPKEPKTFRADHPFIFYIRVNNIILFAGRISAPQF